MLILGIGLTGFAGGACIIALVSAFIELALRNYLYSMLSSAVVLMFAPVMLIGMNLIELATPLAYR